MFLIITSKRITLENRAKSQIVGNSLYDFVGLFSFIRIEVTIKNVIVVIFSLSRFFWPWL